MASFGMMGALGGVGASLQNEAAIMQKEEEANAADARRTKFEQWLMNAREEIAIKAEGRANTESDRRQARDTASARAEDEYKFGKKVERAPQERQIKADDQTSEAATKLAFETENIDTITGNTQAKTEAGRTQAQKREDEAKANYYETLAGDVAANGKRDKKLDPITASTLKTLDDQIEKLSGKWTDGVLKGEIVKGPDGQLGTPEQRAEFKRLGIMRQQREDLIKSARGGEAEPPAKSDPLGRRKSPSADVPPQPGMMGAFTDPNDPAIEAAINDIKDPQERANAKAALAEQRGRAAKPAGEKPAASKTAEAPATPADPAEMLGREVDAARAEYKDLTEPGKRPGLASGAAAREDYARKVESLKAKLKSAESRYQRAVGAQGASFSYARP